MRNLLCVTGIIVLGTLNAPAAIPESPRAVINVSPATGSFINRIDGIVWSPNHAPVADVYVELQNEMMMSLSRLRTDTSGRFSFTVTNSGNYVVKVLAAGTNYMDAAEVVEIVDLTRNSSDQVHVDIYLKYDKRKINVGSQGVAEVAFAQDVPDSARKLYEAGLNDIQANPTQAFQQLDEALKIFPDYFAALNLAGNQLVQQKEYERALPYLVRSVQVNQRSFSSFYALAFACYKLNHRPEATEAARGAVILGPASPNAQFLYGTLLRLNGDNSNAERALLKAKELRKGTPMPEVHMQLALLYNRTNRNKEAVVELEAYLKEAPNAPDKKDIQDLIAKLKKEVA